MKITIVVQDASPQEMEALIEKVSVGNEVQLTFSGNEEGSVVREVPSLTRRYYNNKEVASILNVSLRTLARYRSKGLIPYSVIGHRAYYLKDDVHALIEMLRISPVHER